MKFYEIKTTFEKKKDAQTMAEHLLDKHIIACGQIGRIESHYVWQNKREITKEYLLVVKTSEKLLNVVKAEIAQNHPYDLPEIASTEISTSDEYGKWIEESTKK